MNRREQGKIWGKIWGKIQGPKIGNIYGPKNAESGFMREIQKVGCSLGGKVSGAQNAAPGLLDRIRTKDSSRRGGIAAGNLHVESGHIYTLGHIRWHTNRNMFNDKCEFCKEEQKNLPVGLA
jgi:hypothetical protein